MVPSSTSVIASKLLQNVERNVTLQFPIALLSRLLQSVTLLSFIRDRIILFLQTNIDLGYLIRTCKIYITGS